MQAKADTTEINYELTITDPSSHLLDVEIRIQNLLSSNIYGNLLLIDMHDSINMDQLLISFTAKNLQTDEYLEVVNAHWNGSDKNILINDANDILINYQISQEFDDIITIDKNYSTFILSGVLYKPILDEDNISNIELVFNRPDDWKVLSTLKDLGDNKYQLSSLDDIIDDDWGATRGESLIAGTMSIREIQFDNIKMRLAIFDDVIDDGFPITMDRFEEVVKSLWQFYSSYFGGYISTTPTVVLSPFRSGPNYGNNLLAQPYAGWDHIAAEAVLTYPWALTHHMAHPWWINALSADPDASPEYFLIKEGFNTYTNFLSMWAVGLWQDEQDALLWLDPDTEPNSDPIFIDSMYWGNYRSYKDSIYNTPEDRPLNGSMGYPDIAKAVTFAIILDYRIQMTTGGQKNLGDLFAFLFSRNGGYIFNHSYLVDADELLNALNVSSVPMLIK